MYRSSVARRRCLRAGFFSRAESGRNRRANEYTFPFADTDANSNSNADTDSDINAGT